MSEPSKHARALRSPSRRQLALSAALAGLALAGPCAAQQASRVYRLGVLLGGMPLTPQQRLEFPDLFKSELERHGFVEGRNLVVDRRWAERDLSRLDQLAAELVALKPDVILAGVGTPGARAAQRATRTIPIVFEGAHDPVGSGLVASLPRPGGNITGFALFSNTLNGKRAQLLVDALGKPTMLALLDQRRTEEQRQHAMQGWPVFPGTRLQVFEAGRPEELPALFERMVQQKASGLVVMQTPWASINAVLIAQLATKHRLPAIADGRGFSKAGLMLAYTTDMREVNARALDYVARILRGTATPAELPVEQPTRFLFVINKRVAREFGVRIPTALLLAATDVIE